MPSMDLDWKDCSFRLTLAWKNERVLKDEPELEMIEVAGPAISGSPHAKTGCSLCFGCTLFFSGRKEGEPVENDTGLDFVNVDGSSIRKPPSEDNIFHMKRELGDIMWYWVTACAALNLDPYEVISENQEKLAARYGEKFEVGRSEVRKEGDL